MKKMLKSRIFFFILGALMFSMISAVLAYDYASINLGFTSNDTEWNVQNVSQALNDLNDITSGCRVTCPYSNGDIVFEGGSTGAQQVFNPECTGTYKLEAWGAQGGDSDCASKPGGYGGYSTGTMEIEEGTSIYVNVGGQGLTATKNNTPVDGGYNGGGKGRASDGSGANGECYGSGGGATSFALVSGELKNLSAHVSTGKLLIVAGGGGGSGYYNNSNRYVCYGSGGHGGGVNGVDAYDYNKGSCGTYSPAGGYGGLQVADTRTGSYFNAGTFGQGGWMNYYGEAGGGGGFYGGYSSSGLGAGGGSGYIGSNRLIQNEANNIVNKMYCYNCTESSDLSTYTVSTYGITTHEDERNSNCSSGYSNSPVSMCAKSGAGYARITYLGE